MTPTACPPRPGMRAPRLAVFACALGLALLAGCQSSNSCGMGGSSGYQIDGAPGLMACSMASGSNGMASTMTTDVTNLPLVAMNSALQNNDYVYLGTHYFYSMPSSPASTTPMPSAASAATLSLSGAANPLVYPSANDYTLTATATGYIPYCEIASGGLTFVNILYPMTTMTDTLRIYYPPFTGIGTITINCVGVNGVAHTTLATITITVP